MRVSAAAVGAVDREVARLLVKQALQPGMLFTSRSGWGVVTRLHNSTSLSSADGDAASLRAGEMCRSSQCKPAAFAMQISTQMSTSV